MFFLLYGLADSQKMTTTTTTLPEPKYRRLDMANLPPHRLEKISPQDYSKTIPGDRMIRFKNVWDDETEATLAAEQEKSDMSRIMSRRTQTKSTKMRRRFCKFCQQRGFPLAVCKTHYTKSGPEFGSKITCPALLEQQCARCGEIGHTPKYCKSEYWLNTDPCEISSHRDPWGLDWFNLDALDDARIPSWQKPIPPALQKRHEEYEMKYVKPSRVWIEMTGDHKHYTNDFRIVMCIESRDDDWFHVRPRTEYEEKVQKHYEWMRTVMWDETRQTNCHNFFIVKSPPPTYEEANAAAEILLGMTDGGDGGVCEFTSALRRLPQRYRADIERVCADAMRDILKEYQEHQGLLHR
jgi:hypothetical protein